MANKETGLIIPVSAYADKNSAKAAINELTKGVLSSLKDGYIEVPAEIKASYTRGSKELDKAQKDVIKMYEKMSKEGFSSSIDDLDDLIEKYKKFKRLAGKEGKSNSKQTRWLTKTIGETLQPYLTQKRELDKIIASFEESVIKIEKSTKRSTNKSSSRKSKNYALPSDEEINNDIKKHKERQYKGWESTGAKGYRSDTGIDPGKTNEHLMRLSKYSPHGSKWASELARTLKIEIDKAAETLVTWIDHTYKVGGKDNKVGLGNKRPGTTEQEMLTDVGNYVREEIKRTIKAMEKGDMKVNGDTLITQAAVLKTVYGAIGKGAEEASMAVSSAIQSVKDVGPDHEFTEKAIKELLDVMKVWSDEAIIDRMANEMISAGGNLNFNNAQGKSQADKVIKEIAEANDSINKTNMIAEQQREKSNRSYLQDIRESSRESLADTAAGRTSKDSLDVEKSTLNAIENQTSEKSIQTLTDTTSQIYVALKSIQDILKNTFKNDAKVQEVSSENKALIPSYIDKKTGMWVNTKAQNLTKRKKEPKRVITTEEYERSQYEGVSQKQKTTINDPDVVAGIEKELEQVRAGQHELQQRSFVEQSEINTYQKGLIGVIQKALKPFLPQSEAERILAMNKEEQNKARAERLEMYGENRGKDLKDTGSKASVRLTKQLFGWIYKNDEKNKELFQNVKLTEGFTGEKRYKHNCYIRRT